MDEPVENPVDARPTPRIACNPDGIPEELRKLPQWVAFKYTAPKKPGAKHGKVPIDPRTGKNASTTNFATWGTFAQALERTHKDNLGGVGFVFTDSGYGGVDLDHCRDPETGAIEPWAEKIVEDFATYTEVSPSGTGVHCIVRGTLEGPGRKKGNVEVYSTGRYFTTTGKRVRATPDAIADGQAALARLVASFNRSDASLLDPPVVQAPHVMPAVPRPAPPRGPRPLTGPFSEADLEEWRKDAEFERLWSGDHSGYPSQSEADLRLTSMIGKRVKYDPALIDTLFRRSGLYRPKWDEIRGGHTYGQKTIQRVVDSATQVIEVLDDDEAVMVVPAVVPPVASVAATVPAAPVPPVVRPQPPRAIAPEDHRVARALTDTGNAERLVAKFGERIRHVSDWGKWIGFTGTRWRQDAGSEVLGLTKQVARGLYVEASQIDDPQTRQDITSWAKASEKAERRRAMLTLAPSEKGISIPSKKLDTHTHLFNVANGTLDLETFTLRTPAAADYLTKRCAIKFEPSAQCPLWLTTLERVMPDPEIRDYFQRFAGYCLTGEISEQMMLFLVGNGANGKSTIANVLLKVLSDDYAIQIAPDVLVTKSQRSHPTEIADLFGVRLAFSSETAKGQSLDEALVKQLTGGDPLRARRMREDFWQFDPTHKLVLLTNHVPEIEGQEHAIWRRLHCIPFNVTIQKDEIDPNLVAKLLKEREGILAWAVEGCRAWRARGLDAPAEVQMRPDTTPLKPTPTEEFVTKFVVRQRGTRTAAKVLYDAYMTWCTAQKHGGVSKVDFGTLLGTRGFGSLKSNGLMVYVDTALGEQRGAQGVPPAMNGLFPPASEVTQGVLPSLPVTPQDAGEANCAAVVSASVEADCDRWERG
ncbi:MAG: phage/plasmid primase, P4 family [Rhodoglobus sp.]